MRGGLISSIREEVDVWNQGFSPTKSAGPVLLISALAALFLFQPWPVSAQQTGQLTGYLYADDLRTPVPGAILKLKNILDQTVYESAATGADGFYSIVGIKPGQYVLGVQFGADGYNCEYILYIKGGEAGQLSLALRKGKKAEVTQPVFDAPVGLAEKLERRRAGFFTTPAGIATIVVAASATGYGIYHLLKPEEEKASPAKK
jgi:hypothetical protein